MTSNPADYQTPGGSVTQSAQDSTLLPPPEFPTIQETPTFPNPVPAGQNTIAPDDGIAAFKAGMRMEMEELRNCIENMAAEKAKGKQVAEDPGNNNLESTPENENSGSQLPNPEQQAPPNLQPTSHVAATNQPTQQQVWPGAYAYPPQGYYYPQGYYPQYYSGYGAYAQAAPSGIYQPTGIYDSVIPSAGVYNPVIPSTAQGHVRPPPPAERILAPHVQAAELDKNYKMPMKLTPYTGVKDPEDHLLGF